MKVRKLVSIATVAPAMMLLAGMAFAQTDPGVRGGTVDSGKPLASFVDATKTPGGSEFFTRSLANFQVVESVRNSPTGDNGLGPRFNENSCAACHSQPATGGSSPASNVFPNIGPNPQSQIITQGVANGTFNTMPTFVHSNGPVREARFPFFFDANGNPNPNDPNGGVEDLFTIVGRSDVTAPSAGGCNIVQPSFAQATATNNIIFRIPTPVFGAGLIENIDDSTLLTNQANNANNGLGISGTFNHNGNDGTISRFGWKAQNKSLMLFSGEAYNVEMGITNEIFGQERPIPGEGRTTGLPSNCRINPTPEDSTNFVVTARTDQAQQNADVPSDVARFAIFMRALAPPTPSTTNPGGATSISNGRSLFSAVGCAVCHTPTLTTDPSAITPDLSSKPANLFSDLQIHHMGTNLADNVSQGGAGGDQFRSSPLWGLGQRIFFLHDGRSVTLTDAIAQHSSNGSEANTVISNFQSLSASQQQDLLNFLRSL
ncbi:MAG TPA: di-heme oxidoredictase family protein [Candidatus Angelobacter sp.]|nr:di-heme oxidoredictase family protein [Candidatus Angelobacter sp.]